MSYTGESDARIKLDLSNLVGTLASLPASGPTGSETVLASAVNFSKYSLIGTSSGTAYTVSGSTLGSLAADSLTIDLTDSNVTLATVSLDDTGDIDQCSSS